MLEVRDLRVCYGAAPALWGAVVKRLDIGIAQQPIVLGDILINRAYFWGGLVAFVLIGLSLLFFTSRQGVVLRAVADDQAASWAVGMMIANRMLRMAMTIISSSKLKPSWP